MSRPLLLALAITSSLFSFSASASSFCVVNETDKPVWLSLSQQGSFRRGKLVSPQAELCSTYQARRMLFISVSKNKGVVPQCHQTLEPSSPPQLFLESVHLKNGCTWAVKTMEARPKQHTRSSFLCKVLAKDSSSCEG